MDIIEMVFNNENGELWVRVHGGLCNRLRVLGSAIGFSKATNRKLVINWPTTSSFWRPKIEHRFEGKMKDLWIQKFTEVNSKKFRTMENRQKAESKVFPPNLSSSSPILIFETGYPFDAGLPERYYDYAKRLVLTKEISQRIDYYVQKCSVEKRYVGIHVRSTAAHIKTLNSSPIEWFEKRISEILSVHPNIIFFLSTDSQHIVKRLVRLAPNQIIHQGDLPPYNSKLALQKALVDLYVLSKSEFILGSYYSSFSSMAAGFQDSKNYEDPERNWGSIL